MPPGPGFPGSQAFRLFFHLCPQFGEFLPPWHGGAVAFLEPHPAGMDDFCHSFAHSGQGGRPGDQVEHIFRVHGDAVEAAFCQKAAFASLSI